MKIAKGKNVVALIRSNINRTAGKVNGVRYTVWYVKKLWGMLTRVYGLEKYNSRTLNFKALIFCFRIPGLCMLYCFRIL